MRRVREVTGHKWIVLVTGAGAGIGQALACELAREGHQVYAGVRDMKRAATDFPDRPGNLTPLELDVTNPAHVHAAVARIVKDNGRIDVLVNNAGFGVYGALEELTLDDMRRQFETNFFGAVDLTKAVIPHMRKERSGRIINVSSILGRIAIPSGAAYTSSKWALEAFSESLRYELFPFGIHVVLVEPGLIRTNFKKSTEFPENLEDSSSPYAHLHRLMNREYGGFYTPAAKAGLKIARIIRKKNPSGRYRVGLDAIGYNTMRALLPDAVIDWMVKMRVRRAMSQRTSKAQ